MSLIDAAIELTKEYTKDYKILRLETPDEFLSYISNVAPWLHPEQVERIYCMPPGSEFLYSLKDPFHPHKYRYKIYNEGIVDKTWCFTKSGKCFFCAGAANMLDNTIILINEALRKGNLDFMISIIFHEICHLKYRTLDENFCDIYSVEMRNLLKASLIMGDI